MIYIIDGPEKAGKTTAINAVIDALSKTYPDRKFERIGWGPVDEWTDYIPHVLEQHNSENFYFWDRGWPSETVYGRLLNRNRVLQHKPLIGDFFLTQRVRTFGRTVMCLENTNILKSRRDETDLPVDPLEEYNLYQDYANMFGWHIMHSAPLNEWITMFKTFAAWDIQRLAITSDFSNLLFGNLWSTMWNAYAKPYTSISNFRPVPIEIPELTYNKNMQYSRVDFWAGDFVSILHRLDKLRRRFNANIFSKPVAKRVEQLLAKEKKIYVNAKDFYNHSGLYLRAIKKYKFENTMKLVRKTK